MEFPNLGKHCSKSSCNRLDFLPIKCDVCSGIFCEEHYNYASHDCQNAYKKNNQVPVCPLCNIPIPVGPNQQPDVIIGMHIDNDCQSDHLKNKKKVFSNRCSFKNCKQKEIIPILCSECTYNYCLKHRHPVDHKCEGEAAARRKKMLDAAINRRNNREQQTLTVSDSRHVKATQGSLSEDEALARALALSMQETGVGDKTSQEQLDLNLARQLQALESRTTASSSSSSRDRCNIT